MLGSLVKAFSRSLLKFRVKIKEQKRVALSASRLVQAFDTINQGQVKS